MIQENHLFFYTAEQVVDHELAVVAAVSREALGSAKSAAKFLGWKPQTFEQFLKRSPLPELGGSIILSIQIAEISGLSLAALRREIRYRLVAWALRRFGSMWSNYQIADFLDIEETMVRRIRNQGPE